MDLPLLINYMPESISLIIEPHQQRGGLYLGNIGSLGKSIQKYNIQAAITVCKLPCLAGLKLNLQNHYVIDIEDQVEEDLLQYFDQTNKFIAENLKNGNVLVHCMAGISRSAAVVIAYVMWNKGMQYQNALLYVSQKREIIYPNEGFRKQLKEFEIKLKQQAK